MTQQVSLLKENCQELYYALSISDRKYVSLVANYSGTHLYDSTKSWGRLWCWFYRIVDMVFGTNLRLEKLKKAIIHTFEIFQKQQPIIQNHLNNYQTYLKRASSGYTVNEEPIQKDRCVLSTWDNATRPFLKVFHHIEHKKMQRLLRLCFKNTPPTSYLSQSLMSEVNTCRKIIALEGVSATTLPLAIIKKIFKQKTINSSEIKEIKKWIEKLNKQTHHLNTIHKGIVGIATFFNSQVNNKENTSYFPEALEAFMEDNGCSVFKQSDPKQMNWRKQWKPKALIPYQKGLIDVGQRIGNAASQTTDTLIFELKSSPECMALIPQNRMRLALSKIKQTQQDALLPHVRLLDIMDGGRWAVIERLTPIYTGPWKSQNLPPAKEDLPKLNTLAAFIAKCIDTNSTPSNFSPTHLMFDGKGELKSLTPTVNTSFDFNALETFASRCAAGNLAVFQYLMKTSRLIQHTTAKYYAAIAASTLKKESIHLANLAGVYRIGDSQVVDRAAAFAKELSDLHKQILQKIQERTPDGDPELLEQEVGKTLLSCYRKTCGGGILWPTLAKSVIKNY